MLSAKSGHRSKSTITQIFTYGEFKLDVADKWKRYVGPEEDVLMLQSAEDNASLTVSTHLMEIAIDKAQGIADSNIRSRIEAHKTHYPNLQLIDASIAVHSSGAALEMFYSVAETDKAMLMYIGWVTPKKVLSALLVAPANPAAAADLFRQTMSGLQPRIP